jgi:hypothetical protein
MAVKPVSKVLVVAGRTGWLSDLGGAILDA